MRRQILSVGWFAFINGSSFRKSLAGYRGDANMSQDTSVNHSQHGDPTFSKIRISPEYPAVTMI